jgi:hypothetical protein
LKNTANESQWCPFRPNATGLERIANDVAEIPDIQQKLLANDADFKFLDVSRTDTKSLAARLFSNCERSA